MASERMLERNQALDSLPWDALEYILSISSFVTVSFEAIPVSTCFCGSLACSPNLLKYLKVIFNFGFEIKGFSRLSLPGMLEELQYFIDLI